MASAEPAAIAASLENSAELAPGEEERFVGYGVMAAPFASGDLLAMRRFPVSSLGTGYTTVWHRAKGGAWTIYSDREPSETCPRYFSSALARTMETPIRLSWPGPRRMEVTVPAAELEWSIDLAPSATTHFMNALGRSMSDAMWRSPRVLEMMSRFASAMLHAGRLGLSGRAPNGQWFIANPMTIWLISASSASMAGRNFGALSPLPEQAQLGDFWLPQRGLFAFGRAFFEPLDPTRHTQVSKAVERVPVSP